MDASSTRREVLIGGGVALAHGAASLLRRISTSNLSYYNKAIAGL